MIYEPGFMVIRTKNQKIRHLTTASRIKCIRHLDLKMNLYKNDLRVSSIELNPSWLERLAIRHSVSVCD